MAIRDILLLGDPTLEKRSREVTAITPRLQELIDDMIETMQAADGAGLAAPQVGVLRRVVIVDGGEGPIPMINPVILLEEGEQTDAEGCLSVPNRHYPVTRPKVVRVEYMDRDGKSHTDTVSDLLARAVCHEVDHLDGRLFLAKVSETEIQEGPLEDRD